MRVDRKVYGILLLIIVVGAAAGCSSMKINVPLDTQPPAYGEEPASTPTDQAELNTHTPASSPTSPLSTLTDQPASGPPAMSVSPRHTAPGSDVTVRLRGFPERAPVDIGVGRVNAGYDVIAEGMTGPMGTMKIVVFIPEFVGPDDEWVMVAAVKKGQVKVVSDRMHFSDNTRQASVEVSSQSLEPGSTVEVRAQGFTAGADLKIGIGRVNSEFDVFSREKAGPDGSLVTAVTIPEFVDPDDEWVIVVQDEESTAKAVSGKLQVESPGSHAVLEVLSTSVAVGGTVDVRGSGLPAGAEVALGIGRVKSEYDLTESVHTDVAGQFRTQFTIPDFADPEDEWVLVAVADDGRIKAFSEQVKITR